MHSMSNFGRRIIEDYSSVSRLKDAEGDEAYSMIQLFEREYNKTTEQNVKNYFIDEEKIKLYYDDEKEIRADFFDERNKISKEIEDEYKGKLLIKCFED